MWRRLQESGFFKKQNQVLDPFSHYQSFRITKNSLHYVFRLFFSSFGFAVQWNKLFHSCKLSCTVLPCFCALQALFGCQPVSSFLWPLQFRGNQFKPWVVRTDDCILPAPVHLSLKASLVVMRAACQPMSHIQGHHSYTEFMTASQTANKCCLYPHKIKPGFNSTCPTGLTQDLYKIKVSFCLNNFVYRLTFHTYISYIFVCLTHWGERRNKKPKYCFPWVILKTVRHFIKES